MDEGRKFASARYALRMSREDLARVFGLKYGAIKCREDGKTPIRPIDWMALLWLREGGEPEQPGTAAELRRIREDDLVLTQAELAQELGITVRSLSRLELGRNPIKPYMWLAMKYLAKKG